MRKKILNPQVSNKKIDYSVFFTVVILVSMGLILVYDASALQSFRDWGDEYYYIKQQIIWVFLSFTSLFFFSRFNYKNFKNISLLLFIFSLILMLMVLVPGLGVVSGGAQRWLKLGFFSIQPAEVIKLSSIIFFASIFEKKVTFPPFATVVIIVSVIMGFLQKDLGSTAVFFTTSTALYIIAGAPLRYFLSFLPISIAGFIFFILSSDYRRHRVLAFLDPFSDPQGYSYHISQILIALGSGGLFGLGLGQSRQKFEYIPEVTTDSIFAVVGEEFGFIGSLVLIGLFAYLVYKCLKIAERTDDNFGKLLASGLAIWLGIQAVVNLGAMVSLIPLTGVPLPFISYGGSALIVNLTAVGILLNISKSTHN